MAIVRTEITISKSVAASTEEAETFTPAVGEFFISQFDGDSAFNGSSFCKLIWDYGGAGETVLWSTAGSMSRVSDIKLTGDGVKKVAVTLDNGLGAPVYMSASAKIVQEV